MTGPGTIISDPCTGHECRKGSQCVPSPIGNGYTCRCQTGWQGRYCEKGTKIHDIEILLIINEWKRVITQFESRKYFKKLEKLSVGEIKHQKFYYIYYLFLAAPTCRKEHTREYYSENGCRSRRPVKLAKCWGSCGNSCCLPRKTKRRKVRVKSNTRLNMFN